MQAVAWGAMPYVVIAGRILLLELRLEKEASLEQTADFLSGNLSKPESILNT